MQESDEQFWKVLISTCLGRRVCANPHVAPVAAKHLPLACSGADLACGYFADLAKPLDSSAGRSLGPQGPCCEQVAKATPKGAGIHAAGAQLQCTPRSAFAASPGVRQKIEMCQRTEPRSSVYRKINSGTLRAHGSRQPAPPGAKAAFQDLPVFHLKCIAMCTNTITARSVATAPLVKPLHGQRHKQYCTSAAA